MQRTGGGPDDRLIEIAQWHPSRLRSSSSERAACCGSTEAVSGSRAVWVPFLWLTISSSRPVSEWVDSSGARRGVQYLEGSPLDRNIVTSLIILGLLALWKRRAQTKDILRANAPVVVFLLYCLVSALWADYPFVTLKRWVRAVADIVMVLVVLTDPAPEAAFRWVLSRVAYVLVPLSVLLIRFYPEIGRDYSQSGEQLWTGVGTSKNGLGALCMVAGIGVLWSRLAPASSKSWDRIRQRIALGTVFLILLCLLWIGFQDGVDVLSPGKHRVRHSPPVLDSVHRFGTGRRDHRELLCRTYCWRRRRGVGSHGSKRQPHRQDARVGNRS